MELNHIVFLYSLILIFHPKSTLQTCEQTVYGLNTYALFCENFTSDDNEILQRAHYEYIGITNSNFKELNLKMLDLVGTFTSLQITASNIEKIDSDVFNGLSVNQLNLENNTIRDIDGGSFNGLLNLRQLDLGYNQITDFNNRTFAHLDNLTILNLEHNEISVVKTDFLNGLLSVLNLSNNKIFKVETGAFDNITNLLELYLSYNQIKNIPIDVFDNLYNLNLITLEYNQISQLQIGCFKRLNKLKIMDLSSNQITTLDLGIFIGLHNLEYLNLRNNQLTTLNPGIFHNCDRIRILNLSYNNFKNIDVTSTLSHLVSDRIEVYLEGNQWLCSILSQMITENQNLLIHEGSELNVTNIRGNYCTNEATFVRKQSKINTIEELGEDFVENKTKQTDNNGVGELVKILTDIKEELLNNNNNEAALKVVENIENRTHLELKETNKQAATIEDLLAFISILFTITVIIIIVDKFKSYFPFQFTRKQQTFSQNEQEMVIMS